MNHTFRLVWSPLRRMWIAAAETARRMGKCGGTVMLVPVLTSTPSAWAVDEMFAGTNMTSTGSLWSVGENWADSSVPLSADDLHLIFDATAMSFSTNHNLGNLQLNQLSVSFPDLSSMSFTLTNGGSGSTLTFSGTTPQISIDNPLAVSRDVSILPAIVLEQTLTLSSSFEHDRINLGGPISGEGGLTISGGVVNLQNQGGATYGGATWVEAGGTLRSTLYENSLSANSAHVIDGILGIYRPEIIGSLAGSGSVGISEQLTVGTLNTDTLFSGSTLLEGRLNKVGTGTLTLTGAISHTGGTIITGGTLQIGNGGTSGSLVGDIANNSALVFNRSDAYTYGANISGTGSLAQQGSGTLILTGANTYTGGTNINAGTLQIGNGGTTGSISGNVTNNGSLIFNRSDAVTYGGTISGSGTLIKRGADSLALTGVHTYTGDTIVEEGTLTLRDGGGTSSLSRSRYLRVGTVDGQLASLNVESGSQLGTAHAFLGEDGGTGIVTVNNATWDNAGAIFIGHRGRGSLTIDSGTVYSSDVFVGEGGDGMLLISNGGRADIAHGLWVGGFVGYGTTTVDEATLSADEVIIGGSGTGGSLVVSEGGILDVRSAEILVADNGTLQIGNGGLAGNVVAAQVIGTGSGGGVHFNHSDDHYFTPRLAGTLSLTKSGSGTTILGAANNYTGGTFIEAGTLQIGSGSNVGSITGDIQNNSALAFDRSDALTYGGSISGTGSLTQQGSGTLILTGNNTYTGGTTISAGILQIGNGGTTGSLVGDIANRSALVFDRSDALTYGGIISDTGSLTQQGSGTLILTGANTYTGGTTISAGTLQIGNGGTTGSLAGDIVNNSDLVFNRSDALNYGDAISGTGSLTQQGAGTLILTGNNTFTRGTTVAAGTLQLGNGGTTGSLVGDIANRSALVFDRSDSLTYGGTISGTGSLTQQGSGTLILTGANSYTGGTRITAGTLQIGDGGTSGSLVGDIANNSALAFNRSDAFTYGSTISGTGSLMQRGSGNLILTGANTYTGNTIVDAGTLSINGSIASATTVNTGATLGGSGRVGSVTVNSGGTLAPGNSPGLLTIDGDLTLNPGSVTRMEINGTARGTEYDALDVSGTATLDGTLDLVFGYMPVDGDRYRLINAGTLVLAGDPTTGFAAITSNLGDALLATPVIDPTTFDILIELAQQSYVEVAGTALTANQRAVGSALDRFSTTGQAADLIAALNTLRAAELPAAMDSLSGVEHGHAGQMAQRSSLRFSRLLAARGQHLGSQQPADTFGSGTDAFGFGQASLQLSYNGELRDLLGFAGQGTGAPRFSGRSGFWITPTTGAGEVEGDGNAAGFDYDYAGLYAGFDRWLNDNLLLGMALGYTRSDSNLHNGAQDVDSLEAALYGRYAIGADYLAASLGYGRHAVDSRRSVAIGSQHWQAEGDYRIDSLSLDVEAGHAFVPQAGTQLTPFVGLGYARHDREDFTERGAGDAALRLDDEALESIHSRLGLRLNQALAPLAGRPLSLEAEAAWVHEFGDHTASLGARFDQAPAAPFRVDGPETDSDRLQASLGLSAELSRASRLFVGYQGEYAGSDREHALSASWQMRW